MAWRLVPAAAIMLLAAACTPTDIKDPGAFDASQYRPMRLSVGSIEVANAAKYPADLNFIARRRSEQLAQDAQTFLHSRLVAAGGADFARATVEEASLIEGSIPDAGGTLSTAPNWQMVGTLALRVAVIDGLGIEQSFATSRVEIKRSISQRAGVEAKDDFARKMINDLIAASSKELETSINQNLADRKAI